ncbi:MAG: glycoside hydrolase family 71/99 protein [Armatimonadota bacterium]
MRRLVLAFMLLLILAAGSAYSSKQSIRDIYSDTWVGTDALGRTMPQFADVGAVKKDQRRVVGIFYITWHSDPLSTLKSPYTADVSKVLAADPKARFDANHPLWTEGSYHWGEPETGYFLSKDEYVIRKDMSMLADAGVDVLVMDVTNAVEYWDEWHTVFPVMQKMKAEGNKVPKFCFWAFNGPVITVVQDLYDKIYKEEKYKDLWFMWDGKPLLLYNGNPSTDANGQGVQNPNPHYDASAVTDKNNPHYGDPDYTEQNYKDYTKEVKNFFTLRTMWWGYYEWAGKRFIGTEDNWSFGYDMGDERVRALDLDKLISTHKGAKEEAAVTPGQHPATLIGKSWTREKGEPELNDQDLPVPTYVPWLKRTVKNSEGYGIYFQDRWDEALKANPQFLYINDWNEWTAGKYQLPNGEPFDFMRRKNPYYFVDQYNAEFNRCIQPMKGGYTDNYYMQMAQNIRKYKGIRPIPELQGYSRIKVDGEFKDWNRAKVEYRDTIGDVFHRDNKGYGGLHYANDSGRNDIIASKVAVDNEKIYFYVEANNPLTLHTGQNWMLLLIDADKDAKTGWFGYDYLVNKSVVDDKTTTIMKYSADTPDNQWVEIGKLDYRYKDKSIELAIPRKLLGLGNRSFTFDFHWADNPADLVDPISLCVNGDSAPNRRFNYRCIWQK